MDDKLLQERRERAIIEVCFAGSVDDAWDAYLSNRRWLSGCKFVLSAAEGTRTGFTMNRTLPGGFVVRNLFAESKLYFIDEETLSDAQSGEMTIGFDQSIGLDTQTVSYLEPYITKRAKVPDSFADVFSFIASRDVDVNPMPYMLENYQRIYQGTQEEQSRIYSKFIFYETLRTLDIQHFQHSNEVRSTLDAAGLNRRAQELMSKAIYEGQTEPYKDHLHLQHDCFYALLLKMAVIQIASPQRSTEAKLIDFLRFCDVSLSTIWKRETLVALQYFERGQKFPFFGKVQKSREETFDSLRGMAWDLFHVRRMEGEFSLRPGGGARYFIPAFLTCDAGLIEVIDLCPLMALVVGETGRGPIPFYKDDGWAGTALESIELQHRIHDLFYSDEVKVSRMLRLPEARANLSGTVRSLEIELAKTAKISCPVPLDGPPQ